jgi:hypothetical protein
LLGPPSRKSLHARWDNGEILLTLDANTGKELWFAKLGEVLKNGWGDGPRGTPVDGDRVFARWRQHACLRGGEDGKEVWRRTMKELEAKLPTGVTRKSRWIAGQVVCTPAARGAMAYSSKDGKDAMAIEVSPMVRNMPRS